MEDVEYDKMMDELANLEQQYPQWKQPDSPTEAVGAPVCIYDLAFIAFLGFLVSFFGFWKLSGFWFLRVSILNGFLKLLGWRGHY